MIEADAALALPHCQSSAASSTWPGMAASRSERGTAAGGPGGRRQAGGSAVPGTDDRIHRF
jgi:hypothetical protein